jgi:hypothetical protein
MSIVRYLSTEKNKQPEKSNAADKMKGSFRGQMFDSIQQRLAREKKDRQRIEIMRLNNSSARNASYLGGATDFPSCLTTYLPTHLPTYLPTYLPTHLPTYLPTYLPTSIPTYLPTSSTLPNLLCV